jgi:hypothetical protein
MPIATPHRAARNPQKPMDAEHEHDPHLDQWYEPSDADLEAVAEAESWRLHEEAEQEVLMWREHYNGEKFDRLAPPMPTELRAQMVEAVDEALQTVPNQHWHEASFATDGEPQGICRRLTAEANQAVVSARQRTLEWWRRRQRDRRPRRTHSPTPLGRRVARSARPRGPRTRTLHRVSVRACGPDDDSGPGDPPRVARSWRGCRAHPPEYSGAGTDARQPGEAPR